MAVSPIPLHLHSPYSLSQSALRLADVTAWCHRYKIPAAGFCDDNNLFGALEIAGTLLDAGIQPIIGLRLAVTLPGEGEARLPLYAASEAGYRRLLALTSKAYLQAENPKDAHLSLAEVLSDTMGLLVTVGGQETHLGRMAADGRESRNSLAAAHLETFIEAFGDRLFLSLPRHGIPAEDAAEPLLLDMGERYGIPYLAQHDVFFASEKDVSAHEALLCIGLGTTVSDPQRPKSTPFYALTTPGALSHRYVDIPEAISNTQWFAKRCHFVPKGRRPMLPRFAEGDEGEALRLKASTGLEDRLSRPTNERRHTPDVYRERLAFELNVIHKMGFDGYFLIVADFIGWAKQQGIPVGPGRGSGAGSIVAWALKITDLDPLAFDLLFERFLNPERVSMPDFDIDFCQDRRDEVIRYVQQRYSSNKVAQIITFGKLQARAVLRDVGRVLDVPYAAVDKLCKLVPNNPASPITLAEAIASESELQAARRHEDTKNLIETSLRLEGLYRHASTHAAGVVIGDQPLAEIVPLYHDPRAMMPVTQFSMKYVEKAGLVKFDFLGLKTLSIIRRTLEIVGGDLDINTIPLDDTETYALLARGETTAVFQLESAGMKDALKKMRPDRFTDIIAVVALYRPGPMENIPRYIACKHGDEQPDYLHPLLEPVLKETFGVMIYQEQVMQAAQVLAGFSLGGADLLRRAMGKKIKAEMDAQQAVFVAGCVKNGLDSSLAETIFAQIAKFADYGFNKSHAAAYALLTYQTAWLKAHHPVAFLATVMHYERGDTDFLSALRDEAKRMGIVLLPPCVNHSEASFSVEKGNIRYALGALKGVGDAAAAAIAEECRHHGAYTSLADLVRRVGTKFINKRTLESLIAAGACDAFNNTRRHLWESIEGVIASIGLERSSGGAGLFGDALPVIGVKKTKAASEQDWPILDRLTHEFQAIGFYLSAHPLAGYGSLLERIGVVSSKNLEGVTGRKLLAGVVLSRKERQSAKGNRYAFVQLADASGNYEVMLFSETLAAARPFLEAGTLLLLSVDISAGEGGGRLGAVEVESLDTGLSRRLEVMDFVVGDATALSQLRERLSTLKPGRTNIEVHVETPRGGVRIKLKGGYTMTAEVLEGIG
ncbi:MAG: DNA polymerase III subunit alpha [Holosporales bacterium]|jgi:DNA polymerase-3 subunit alpha